MISDASLEQIEAAGAFGRHICTAFQLVDDVLDYSGDAAALGKNVGDDLKEGKPTLPLIRVLEVGTPDQIALIRSAIEDGEADFDAVAQAIQENDALSYAMQTAQAEADLARQALDSFPPSECKEALLALCDFAVDRDR